MNATMTCSRAALLQAENLPHEPEALEALAAHFDQCEMCRAALEVPAEDDLLQLLREAADASCSEDEAVAGLIGRVCLLNGAANAETATADPCEAQRGTGGDEVAPGKIKKQLDLGFLAPPTREGDLGRLGPYHVREVLGHGGMGVVLVADDPQLKRQLALKAMLPEVAANPNSRQRFLAEAQAVAALHHDHIVPIYHVGQEGEVPYFAMPLLQGQSLHKRLQGDRLPLAESLRVAREIAEGLAAAHERGLIHRDIKPLNIWLETHGAGSRVKILDFGLALPVEADLRLTREGAIVGTPAYMAPEQAQGQHVDTRADLFSLGCVLYEMLASSPAFKGSEYFVVLMAVCTEEPLPLGEHNPHVPAGVADLVQRLLCKAPKQRPQAAREVVSQLEQLERIAPRTGEMFARVNPTLQGLVPSGAESNAAPEKSVPSKKRRLRRSLAVGLGILGSLLLSGIIIIIIQDRNGSPRAEIHLGKMDKFALKYGNKGELEGTLNGAKIVLPDIKAPEKNPVPPMSPAPDELIPTFTAIDHYRYAIHKAAQGAGFATGFPLFVRKGDQHQAIVLKKEFVENRFAKELELQKIHKGTNASARAIQTHRLANAQGFPAGLPNFEKSADAAALGVSLIKSEAIADVLAVARAKLDDIQLRNFPGCKTHHFEDRFGIVDAWIRLSYSLDQSGFPNLEQDLHDGKQIFGVVVLKKHTLERRSWSLKELGIEPSQSFTVLEQGEPSPSPLTSAFPSFTDLEKTYYVLQNKGTRESIKVSAKGAVHTIPGDMGSRWSITPLGINHYAFALMDAGPHRGWYLDFHGRQGTLMLFDRLDDGCRWRRVDHAGDSFSFRITIVDNSFFDRALAVDTSKDDPIDRLFLSKKIDDFSRWQLIRAGTK